MEKQGYITQLQEQQAGSQTILFNPQKQGSQCHGSAFCLDGQRRADQKYGEQRVANSGFIVKTTLDLSDQEYAEKVVSRQVTNLRFNKVTNGAAVALDPKTGEILSLVGSHDWFDETNGKINMAVRARQPGSSFKPIVYSYGIEHQIITAATVLDDKPVTFPDGYKPLDYDRKFRDNVLVRRALANSLNIPAVHVMEKVGIANTLSYAKQLGITSLTNPGDYGLSLILGAGEVPLIQMTEAYAAFANTGKHITPTTILQITDKKAKKYTNIHLTLFRYSVLKRVCDLLYLI